MLDYKTTMFTDRLFRNALVISLAIHVVILLQGSRLNFLLPSRKEKTRNIEVHYVKTAKEMQKILTKKPAEGGSGRGLEPFLKLPERVALKPAQLPPQVNKEEIFKNNKDWAPQKNISLNPVNPVFVKPEIAAVKTKITLALSEVDKSSSPSYVAHSQIVREKIKRSLYQNYSRIETGQVYLSFVLSRDGYLRQVKLVEGKSSPNPYLREIAMRSIQDAAPFPNFPKELDYDQLSFNVVISFEMQ